LKVDHGRSGAGCAPPVVAAVVTPKVSCSGLVEFVVLDVFVVLVVLDELDVFDVLPLAV
jgi:hypothetical protein